MHMGEATGCHLAIYMGASSQTTCELQRRLGRVNLLIRVALRLIESSFVALLLLFLLVVLTVELCCAGRRFRTRDDLGLDRRLIFLLFVLLLVFFSSVIVVLFLLISLAVGLGLLRIRFGIINFGLAFSGRCGW